MLIILFFVVVCEATNHARPINVIFQNMLHTEHCMRKQQYRAHLVQHQPKIF